MGYEPKGLRFEQFEIGRKFETRRRTITEADIVLFAGLSGDYNPLHTDEEFMKSGPFGGRIAHGMLCASIATGLGNQLGIFEGTTVAVLEIDVKFKGAAKPGDTVRLVMEVADRKESSKPDRGVVIFDCTLLNQRDETVIESRWVALMRRGE